MLKRVSVKNFKSFRKASFELRPITLLIGPNNSGKSSFIALLKTLKQTLASRNLESPFVLEGPYGKLGSYSDVVFNHDIEKKIEIELKFGARTKSKRRIKKGSLVYPRLLFTEIERFAPLTIIFQVEFDAETETIRLGDLEVIHGKDILIRVRKRKITKLFNRRTRIPIDIEEPEKRKRRRVFITQRHFLWNVSLARRIGEDRRFLTSEYYLRRVTSSLEQYFDESLLYLGPLREYPKRYYISSGEKPSDVGLRGEKTVDFLYPRATQIVNQITSWLTKFEMAKQIEVKRVVAGVWKVELTNWKTGLKDNLKDVGFGVSQILPIITEGIMAKAGTTLVIEQPEIHLHPRAQANLSDLFIQLAKEGKNSIIETHSEHMILRFARRVAEGKLKKEDIVIYDFNLHKSGTQIKEVTFDEFGNLKEWPAKFFETDLEETMKHIKAQIHRKKKGGAKTGSNSN
jgi:predicted ATPase